jgi:hypothetical protein
MQRKRKSARRARANLEQKKKQRRQERNELRMRWTLREMLR